MPLHRSGLRRLALATVVLATGATAACGEVGCVGTSLEARPATFRANGSLVFEAELTAGGDPVEGAPIIFYSRTVSEEFGEGGHSIGDVETDADGVATLAREQGLTDMAAINNEVVGYQASFRKIGEVGGTVYCSSQTNGTIEGP